MAKKEGDTNEFLENESNLDERTDKSFRNSSKYFVNK